MTDAKKYNRIKIILSITGSALSMMLLWLSVQTGVSNQIYAAVSQWTTNIYLQFLLFSLLLGFITGILLFPLNFYSGYILEHRFNLSNQTFLRWILEGLKGTAVSLVIMAPVALGFYYFLRTTGPLWWLWFTCFMVVFSVLLSTLFPLVIFPIFYKQKPLDDEGLTDSIVQLVTKEKLRISKVAQFDMSKDTKKGNAMFTGLGKTKRILLGDTLVTNYTNSEILTVIAHELGHFRHKHIIKNVVTGTLNSFITLYLVSVLYQWLVGIYHYDGITAIPALPLLMVCAGIIGVLQSPLHNAISRSFEYQADKYAVKITGDEESFKSALTKLNEQNLGDKDPHPFIEWFSYSHPSIKNRIAAIDAFVQTQEKQLSNNPEGQW
ncbi:MAG: M48 family metallopeptidase [Ignavibacteria bacterium]|nr:M48 family metallopeptidase [Ignavibacteria bacterium]